MAFEKKKIVRGLGWVAFSKYANRILGFITTLILAKLLSPEDFGLVALAVMVIDILKIFKDMGFGQALIYRKDRIEEASNAVFYMTIALNSALFLLVVLLSPFTADFFGDSRVTAVLVVMSTSLIWMALGVVPNALIRKEIDFHKLVVPEIVPVIVGSVIGIAMAFQGYGVWSLVARALLVEVLGVILVWRIAPFRPTFSFDKEVAKDLIHYGKFIVGTSIFAVALYNVDKFYISKIEGLASLGVYTLALAIASLPVGELGLLVCRVMFPVFTRMNDDIQALQSAFTRTFRFVSAATFPMAIGIATFGPSFTELFFDEKWAAMKVPLQILAVASLLRALSMIIHELIRAMGNPKQVQHFIIYRLLLVGGLGIPAVMYFGLEGICVLITVTYFSALIWESRVMSNMLGLHALSVLKATFKPLMVSLVAMPGVYWSIRSFHAIESVEIFWVGVLGASVVYAALLLPVDRIVREEIARMLNIKGRA